VIDVNVTTGTSVLVTSCDWTDALFDVTWSEDNENVIVAAGGDGSVIVWNISMGQAILLSIE